MNQTIVLVLSAALLLPACGDDTSSATTGSGGGASGGGGSAAEGGGSPAGTGGGGGAAPEPITLEEYFLAEDRAYCSWAMECCGKVRYRDDITSAEQCATFTDTQPTTIEGYEEAIAQGRVTFDGVAAARCIEALPALGCGENFWEASSALCPDVLVAQAGIGEVCRYSGCAEGGICVQGIDGTPRCQQTVPTGASCTADDLYCDWGDYCDWNGSMGSGLCEAGAPDGTTCTFWDDCASGFCNPTDTGSACGPRPVCEED